MGFVCCAVLCCVVLSCGVLWCAVLCVELCFAAFFYAVLCLSVVLFFVTSDVTCRVMCVRVVMYVVWRAPLVSAGKPATRSCNLGSRSKLGFQSVAYRHSFETRQNS